MLKNKKFAGIIWTLIIWCIFYGISYLGLQILSGSSWYIFSTVLRIIFGAFTLLAIRLIYSRKPAEVLKPVKTRDALISGSMFILYTVYFLIIIITGFSEFHSLTAGLLFSRVILQQAATGFFEELLFRALFLEGYFYFEKRNWKTAAVFLLMDFAVFGLIHMTGGFDISRFALTGIIGMSMSVIYLRTRNILVPVILHFIYDIIANLEHYITLKSTGIFVSIFSLFDFVLALLAFGSVILMFRDDKDMKNLITEKKES